MKPKLRLPRRACDTHFHVFAADAPKETLFALHAHLGIERGVVVQSAAHGKGNYGLVVDLIGEIAPTGAQREASLVDNPQRFSGFDTRRSP
jgi:hypothetical protein